MKYIVLILKVVGIIFLIFLGGIIFLLISSIFSEPTMNNTRPIEDFKLVGHIVEERQEAVELDNKELYNFYIVTDTPGTSDSNKDTIEKFFWEKITIDSVQKFKSITFYFYRTSGGRFSDYREGEHKSDVYTDSDIGDKIAGIVLYRNYRGSYWDGSFKYSYGFHRRLESVWENIDTLVLENKHTYNIDSLFKVKRQAFGIE